MSVLVTLARRLSPHILMVRGWAGDKKAISSSEMDQIMKKCHFIILTCTWHQVLLKVHEGWTDAVNPLVKKSSEWYYAIGL